MLKRITALIAVMLAVSIYAQDDKSAAQIQSIRSAAAADVADAVARQQKESKSMDLPVDKTVKLGGGVKLELVYIPSGKFFMGEAKFPVQISRGFYMVKYEVTQEQWEAVTGNNPAKFKGSDLPVETVSWDDCKKFIAKLNEKLQDQLGGAVFRLPTEAEWEYACRAGTTGDYEADNLDPAGWYDGNSEETTHRVGGKKPNGWGLYDMHGNVWEWCHDYYGDYDTRQPLLTDPQCASGGGFRVTRGGSWADDDEACQPVCRDYNNPGDGSCYGGFRLVLTCPAK
ncbi:MAG: SUMF1/EgtB/PvdO family nonheme iron enzyme [Victivallaceae bacterium]